MITLTKDSLNNVFIGNLKFGNHSLESPNLNYLKNEIDYPLEGTELIDAIEAAANEAGIIYTISGNYIDGGFEINWSSPDDLTRPSAGRFRLGFSASRQLIFQMRNDNGNIVAGTNSMTSFDNKLRDFNNENRQFIPAIYFTFSKKSVYFGAQVVNSANTSQVLSFFVYGGYLQDVNDNYNYYTENQINSCFVMGKTSNNTWNGFHFIKNAGKSILTTSDAAYPIVCENDSVPTVEWTTGLYIFDNDEELGFPGIGRVDNCIASTSQIAHELGVPAVVKSEIKPTEGEGSNRWLPIGTWLSKTIFVRITDGLGEIETLENEGEGGGENPEIEPET